MGIPSYFFHIIQTYGNRFFRKSSKVSRLFLDLNCCIHGCKNRVLQEYKGDIITKQQTIDFENKVIAEVIRTINRFCEETRPTELLWIAVDGVVPLAKMVQQRERRMRAVEDRKHIRDIYVREGRPLPKEWDSNAITPGTPFMLRMCDTIRSNLNKIKDTCGVKHIDMNDVRIPGEGEQKIFAYLRENPGLDKDFADVIYGLDADLIVLSLLHYCNPTQKSPLILLREEQAFGKLIKTPEGDDVLTQFLVSDFASIIPLEWGKKDDISLLRDYIVLMSLMGNDFVPHTPSLTFRSEAMERIIDAYKAVNVRIVNTKPNKEGYYGIQWNNLVKVIQRLQLQEQSTLVEESRALERIRERIRLGHIPYRHAEREDPVEQEIMAMDWEHIGWDDKLRVEEEGWKERYYKSICGQYGEFSKVSEMKETVCQTYIDSIHWCWLYYNGYPVPGDKCYTFANGPLLEDIVKYLEERSVEKLPSSSNIITDGTLKVNDIPVEAQLIVVLPRQSHHLLPDWTHTIVERCSHLYPTNCKLWYWGKRHKWECVSVLPRIPIEYVTELVNKFKPKSV